MRTYYLLGRYILVCLAWASDKQEMALNPNVCPPTYAMNDDRALSFLRHDLLSLQGFKTINGRPGTRNPTLVTASFERGRAAMQI